MKQGQSLAELATQIKRESGEKQDFLASTEKLEYQPSNGEGSRYGLLHFNVGGEARHVQPTRHCITQIGTHTGIPSKYVDRMADGNQELLAHNINHWFKKEPSTRLLRTHLNGAHVGRAFLSERYRPLDNEDLAETVIPELLKAGCEIISSQITERRLYIQAATPRLELDLNKLKADTGNDLSKVDAVQSGIVISNSEVGAGSVLIEPMIYRLRCFNGMILPTAMRRNHVGRKSVHAELEEATAYFTDATRELDDRAFWSKVVDVVRGTFNPESFRNWSEKFARTSSVKLEAGAVDTVELTAKRFNLNDGEKKSVLDHLIEGGDLSLFGLVNAVTRTAEDAESYDRAIEFERMGGDIIELPQTEWQKIS